MSVTYPRAGCRVLLACRALSATPDDDEAGPQAVLGPHFSQDRPDLCGIECETNHGHITRLGREREDRRTTHERVRVPGEVDTDLVPGREVVGGRREGEREGSALVVRCLRCLDRGGPGRSEGEVQREQEGADGQPATHEGEAPSCTPGGTEE